MFSVKNSSLAVTDSWSLIDFAVHDSSVKRALKSSGTPRNISNSLSLKAPYILLKLKDTFVSLKPSLFRSLQPAPSRYVLAVTAI
ncbi:MAG: hypothetical protein ACP5FY_03230 [Kosmotogaceae bacterium]